MASKTYYAYANGGSNTHYRGKVVLAETNNTESNKSKIDYAFYLYRADGYTGAAHSFNNGNKLVVTINGTTLISSANYKAVHLTGTSESNALLMCSGSIDVAHNSDGTKSFAFSFAYDQTQNAGQELDYLTVAGTHTCTAIARSSVPTLSKSSAEFGTAVTINTNRASSSFTHTIKYKFGTKSGTIATGVGDNTSWTIPNSLMSEIPNAASGIIQIICETYSGSTLIGTQQVDLTATVPAGIVPALTVAVEEAATIPNGISGYIQSRSRLKVTSTGIGQYGASIKSYKTTVEGSDYNGSPVTTNTISGSGTVAVKVTATDSRGRTTTKTVNVTVAAYSAPRLTGVTAYRCASATSTAADSDGAYICVKPRGSITALGKNGKTCTVYYKKASAASYSSKSIAMSDYTLDTEYVIFAADTDCGYNVYVELRDSFSSTKMFAADVMSAGAFIDALLDEAETEIVGMGIGKVAEEADVMDVGWSAKFRKRLTAYADVYLQKGYNVCHSYAGNGQPGYICIAQITIISAYVNHPISFTLSRRGDITHTLLLIKFANANSNDPALENFFAFGQHTNATLVKSAASTWQLYVQKANSYDDIAILDVAMNISYMSSGIAITYPNTFVSAVPAGTGVTKAVRFNTGSVSFWDGAVAINKSCSIDVNGALYAGNANASRAVVQSLDDRARILMQKKVNGVWTNPAWGAYIDLKENEMQTNKKLYVRDSIESASTIKGAELEASGAVTTRGGIENFHATPYIDFHFNNSTSDHTARIIEGTKGILTAFNGITNASDKRLKKAIQDIPEEYFQLVEKLYPKLYRFTKADTYLDAGFIAQDVLKTERELGITKSILVRGTGRQIPDPKDPAKTIIDYFSIDYQSYSVLQGAYFMRKIKEQQEEIDNLKERLERIEKIRADAVSEE